MMKSPRTVLAASILTVISSSALADSQDRLTRVAAVQTGAEITGLFLGPNGELFMNAQHPADSNPAPYNRANITVIPAANFSAAELDVPAGDDMNMITTTLGEVTVLASNGDFDGVLGSIKSHDGSELLNSDDPDFNALVVDGDAGYLFTNWEDRPGGMSRLTLARDGNSWKATAGEMVDFSAVQGTWTNCFGSLSPWNTPLTSEELYFDDTAQWNNKASEEFSGPDTLHKHIGLFPNPYRYGYIVEITDPVAKPTPVKKFALGRFSHENAVVMPDNKTVYLSDDGTDVVFFKFIADKAGDLTAGTLFAAKATQDQEKDPAKAGFDIEWIELAHTTEDQVAQWIAEYDGITPADYQEGKSSYISDEQVAAWASGEASDDRVALLEARKAAAAKGATAEFRKMEGIAINSKVPGKVFMAMSSINKGMSDDSGDIQLDENKCGVVYEMDTDASHNIVRMNPMVAGKGYNAEAADGNACSVDSISNPDNLVVLDNGNVVIGEDTGSHANNMLWVYNRSN